MAITLQELIDTAVSIAGRGAEPSLSPALNSGMVAEDLVRTAFAQVSQTVASDPAKRSMLRRAKTISFSNGSGTVAEDVLTQYLSESSLYNSADLNAIYSIVEQWDSFIRMHDRRLGYYHVDESAINVIEPGAAYIAGSGLTGNRILVVPCSISVPASAGATVSVRDELIDDLVMGLADLLQNPLWKIAQLQRIKVA